MHAKVYLQDPTKTCSSYFYLFFRLILFVFADIYVGVVKGKQCVRRGVCFCCHSFDAYSSVHKALSSFGFIFWASKSHCAMGIYVFLHIMQEHLH